MKNKDTRQTFEASATTGEQTFVEDPEQELTENDLDLVDGGDGGQGTYPPYL